MDLATFQGLTLPLMAHLKILRRHHSKEGRDEQWAGIKGYRPMVSSGCPVLISRIKYPGLSGFKSVGRHGLEEPLLLSTTFDLYEYRFTEGSG